MTAYLIMLAVPQAQAGEESIMTNVALQGSVLTAELGGQLYKATISSHTYLDEQVSMHEASSY